MERDPQVGATAATTQQHLSFEFAMEAYGRTFQGQFEVPAGPARLSDVVPFAREMSSRLMCLFLESRKAAGTPAACEKGCANCCRYLVPLTVPEAIRLAAEIDAQAEPIRGILRDQFSRRAAILSKVATNGDFVATSEAYSGLQIPCPLLAEELCALYPGRPMACREHVAAAPASRCAEAGGGDVLPVSVSLFEVLARLSARLEGGGVEAVPMPQLLAWYDRNGDRAERTWPADELYGAFLQILVEVSGKGEWRVAP